MTEAQEMASFRRDEAGEQAAEDAVRRPDPQVLRMVEALLFASAEPLGEKALLARLPAGADLWGVMNELRRHYQGRGVQLARIGDGWAFRTAGDLAFLFRQEAVEPKKLSRAALEVLAIIAYHQPVTRAEIEEIRGVETSKGTLDLLLETEWVRLRGRRRTPGRPVTYGTTQAFLDHFGLEGLGDLPGADELKGAGLLSPRMPNSFSVPVPPADADVPAADEDPLTDIDLEELGLLAPRAADE